MTLIVQASAAFRLAAANRPEWAGTMQEAPYLSGVREQI